MGRRRFRQQSWDSPAAFAETSVSLQRSTCIPGGASSGAGGYTPERMWPRGQPMRSRLLAGLCRIVKRRAHEEQDCWQEWWPCGELRLKQPVPEMLHPTEQLMKNCIPWEGLILTNAWSVSRGRDLRLEQGRTLPEEEQPVMSWL